MVLLIDGYNILKQITDARFISQQERERFISKLEIYAHRKRHHITLVFDGGEFFKPAYFKISPLMTIVYSGEDRKADDVLKQLVVKQYTDNTLLVTSDYEICKYAESYNIACLGSRAFYSYVVQKPAEHIYWKSAERSARKRTGHESSEDVDALMEDASRHMVIKDSRDYDHEQSGKQKAKKSSKQERRLAHLIQKL